jgi:hypothetical protein
VSWVVSSDAVVGASAPRWQVCGGGVVHRRRFVHALRSYVDRFNLNPDDAPLQLGSGKELDEAAARHVLTELLGDYSVSDNFQVTLSAFTAVGFAIPTALPKLDPDPHRAVHQCLFLLALPSIVSGTTPAPAMDDPGNHASHCKRSIA